MKILIADQYSELGGAQRVLLELLPALQREEWTCILALPGNGPLRTRAEALGIRCEEIACGPFRSGAKSISDLLRFGAQFRGIRKRFRELVEELCPDVFYVNGQRLIPAACFLGRNSPPVLVHLHSYLKQRYIAALIGFSLWRARASVVGNCRFVLEPLRPYLRGSTVEVIYNGVPDWRFADGKLRTGRIGLIGRICPDKGQKVFVEAARTLHACIPQLSFVICGGTQFQDIRADSYLHELRELARGLPVEFWGWRNDIGEVLRSLDLLVVASMPLSEATTRVIPEAFSAGVPVLASALPGIRELVREGETGFLFPAGQAGALASRLLELLGGPTQVLDSVSANARREFEHRFSLEAFHRRMLDALRNSARRATG